MASSFIRWLDQDPEPTLSEVGGKAARLATLIRAGVRCPLGFSVTAGAFQFYLETTGLDRLIQVSLQDNSQSSSDCAQAIIELINTTQIPEDIQRPALAAYREIQTRSGIRQPLAVRSSALVEDGSKLSFAGQFDSFLGIIGERALLQSLRDCWASLYSARSITYAKRLGFTPISLQMAVLIQPLVNARLAGVMFTAHPVTRETNLMVVEAVYGFGAPLVSGRVTPDTYTLLKDELKIVEQHIVHKRVAAFLDMQQGGLVESEISSNLQSEAVLDHRELLALARLGKHIESIFGTPQDIEWVIEDDSIFIVQSRPMTSI